MKRSVAIVFTLLYGIALIRPAFPLVEYYIKMEVYIEQCTNKKRPELHCNGQCILMQKIKAMNIETQEPTAPAPAKINFEDYPIGFVEGLHPLKPLSVNTKPGITITSTVKLSGKHITSIFHPPAPSI
jgi:hypothetical protein